MPTYDKYVDIRKRRPMFNEDTSLIDVPREWLSRVEPKIMRKGFNGHWISYHSTGLDGTPRLGMKLENGNWSQLPLARYVMKIFYEFPDTYYVRRICEYTQCVNPNHLYLSPHWTQE